MRKNPTSPIRKGFIFEELWGLHFCIEWLKLPELYQSISFQTAPDEAEPGRFYLDDIIITNANGTYQLFQVKHRQHPERDLWEWQHFHTRQGSAKESLLTKWAKSLFGMMKLGHTETAAFITNGKPAPDIERFLSGGKIDTIRFKSELPDIYRSVLSAIGTESEVDCFFSSFEFRFNQHEQSAFEVQLRQALYRDLKATEHGANSLILKLRDAFASESPPSLQLPQIRLWCEFDEPRRLDEDFDIPLDFQWFSQSRHDALLREIKEIDGGVKIVMGKPGSGKSTYLSKLHEILTEGDIICVKHHYHISPSDDDPQTRLQASRVIEALKAQLKDHSEALGQLANVNSQNVTLSEFLDSVAQYAQSQRKPFVLIIDGLDHVIRYDVVSELKDFLSQACHPQRGLWIILGMQEIAREQLPQIVLDHAPEEHWITIDGLDDEAVDSLVAKNAIELLLPDHDLQLKPLMTKIREITKGNPLHLRYTLRELKGLSEGRTVADHDLSQIVPYDQEIERYYSVLWRQLSEVSRSMLLALRFIDEPLREHEFLDLAGTLVDSIPDITSGFTGIRHLINVRRHGITFFHSSLELFITQQTEWNQQVPELKRRVKKWLAASNFSYLKWALLPILDYQLGESDQLLQINRSWLIQSMYDLRPIRAIRRHLNLGVEAAFKKRMYGKVLEIGTLDQYLGNALQFQGELADRIWEVGLSVVKPRAADIDPLPISMQQAVSLSKLADKQGELEAVYHDVLTRVNKAHRDYDFRKKGDLSSSPPEVSQAIIGIVSLDELHQVKTVFDYIVQFRDLEWTPDLFSCYMEELLHTGQMEKGAELLDTAIEPEERSAILDSLAIYDLENRSSVFAKRIRAEAFDNLSTSALLYRVLLNELGLDIITLPAYKQFPQAIPEHDSKSRPDRTKLFISVFVKAFCLAVAQNERQIDEWLNAAPGHWPIQMASALIRAGRELGRNSRSSQELDLQILFRAISQVEPLKWPDDRDSLEWQAPIHEVITKLVRLLIALRAYDQKETVLDFDQMMGAVSRQYLSAYHLLKFVISESCVKLTHESFTALVERERQSYVSVVEDFPTRTEHYLDLAELALKHRDAIVAAEMFQNAMDNFVAYGSHKDPLLALVMEAIEACHSIDSQKTIEWANRIGPMAEHVGEFTDGDDVRHFPASLGSLLGKVSPALLKQYYVRMANDEELYLAQDLFAEIIECSNYGNDYEVALARTALDKESLTRLRSVASEKEGAATALAGIEGYFGNVEFKERYQSSSVPEREITEEEIAGTAPVDLAGRLSSMDYSWDKQKFLQKWSVYWLERNRATASSALLSMVNGKELSHVDGELLDIVFPLAYQQDPDRAFDLLCWAQSNDGGWSRYWTNPKKAEARWQIVKAKYPDRYVEFFEESVQRSGLRYGDGVTYNVPLPRAVEYFSVFGDLTVCEEITEASVQQAEQLMANLRLPSASWMSVDEVSTLDLLFQRLVWPSSFVRERAATAIADLLGKASLREEVFSYLCEWIKSQNIETRIILGLLPVVKAHEESNNGYPFALKEIANSIKINSAVIESLIKDLRDHSGQELVVSVPAAFAPSLPIGYRPSGFFQKYINGFLAPHYMHRAEELGRGRCPEFVTRWAYTSEQLLEELGVREQIGRAMDFLGGRMDPILSGMSTNLSEIYRAAFLRTLESYHVEGSLDDDTYLMLSYATMPVELSYWKIAPSRIPDWWPRMKARVGTGTSKEDILALETMNPLEELTKDINGKLVLGMDGAIKFPEGWANAASSARITMVGFGYEVLGSKLPAAEKLASEILYSPMVTLMPSTATKPFRILDSQNDLVQYPTGRLRVGDLLCTPLVGRNRDLTISLWQAFRNYSFFSLCQDLRNDLTTEIAASEFRYMKSGKPVVVVSDWLDGLSERRDKDLDSPHGVYVVADKDFVMSHLGGRNLRLGFVAKISYQFKKYEYEEAKTFDDYRLYGVSSLITRR